LLAEADRTAARPKAADWVTRDANGLVMNREA
jgi:hypothetical protein